MGVGAERGVAPMATELPDASLLADASWGEGVGWHAVVLGMSSRQGRTKQDISLRTAPHPRGVASGQKENIEGKTGLSGRFVTPYLQVRYGSRPYKLPQPAREFGDYESRKKGLFHSISHSWIPNKVSAT